MLIEIFRKRDILIISLMIFLGIVFFIFSLLVPRQQKHPQGEGTAIKPETVQRSSSFIPSSKVKQRTTFSAPQAEERESNDEILDRKRESTERQTENTLPSSAEDASEIASVDLFNPDEEQKEIEESYPVGDLRRLTPEEQKHYEQLTAELQSLIRKQPKTIEERKEREKEHIRRLVELHNKLKPYYQKLGFPELPEGW